MGHFMFKKYVTNQNIEILNFYSLDSGLPAVVSTIVILMVQHIFEK